VRAPEEGDVELNLTPRIDVVFNRIVFFLVLSDLAQKELDPVVLPRASEPSPDAPDGDLRVIACVGKAPDFERSGAVRLRVGGRDLRLSDLRELLAVRAERDRPEPGGASEVPVRIRCDADVPWSEVRWVLQAGAKEPARMVRIQFATSKHEPR
jgi:biopolymer transport protein ExbD